MMKYIELKYILQRFNAFNGRLQFIRYFKWMTVLPCLDVLMKNMGTSILTNLHNKPCGSNKVLNYNSNHPLHQKLNIIINHKGIVLGLSQSSFHNENFQDLKVKLKHNNYLMDFVIKPLSFPSSSSADHVFLDGNTRWFKLINLGTLTNRLREDSENIVTLL